MDKLVEAAAYCNVCWDTFSIYVLEEALLFRAVNNQETYIASHDLPTTIKVLSSVKLDSPLTFIEKDPYNQDHNLDEGQSCSKKQDMFSIG